MRERRTVRVTTAFGDVTVWIDVDLRLDESTEIANYLAQDAMDSLLHMPHAMVQSLVVGGNGGARAP